MQLFAHLLPPLLWLSDGMAAANNVQVWTRADDEQLRRLATCLPPALTGIDLESIGETSEPVSPRARNSPKRSPSQWDKGQSVSNWADVAAAFDGHTEVQCIQRWHKLTHPDSVKGPWCALGPRSHSHWKSNGRFRFI